MAPRARGQRHDREYFIPGVGFFSVGAEVLRLLFGIGQTEYS